MIYYHGVLNGAVLVVSQCPGGVLCAALDRPEGIQRILAERLSYRVKGKAELGVTSARKLRPLAEVIEVHQTSCLGLEELQVSIGRRNVYLGSKLVRKSCINLRLLQLNNFLGC